MHCTMLCSAHLYSYTLDHVEPKSQIQAEQVQWVFGGPQASSCEDANIIVIKSSPGASNLVLEFFLPLYLNYDSCLCIKL
jgi:hypothetical protein